MSIWIERDVYLGLTPSLHAHTGRQYPAKAGSCFNWLRSQALFFCFVWPLSWFRLVSVSSFFSYFILLLQVMEGKGEGGVGERGRHSCQRPGKDSHRHSIATLAVSVGTATNRIRHWAAMQTSRLRLSSIIRHFFFFCLVSVRMFVFVRNCRVKEEKNHWH